MGWRTHSHSLLNTQPLELRCLSLRRYEMYFMCQHKTQNIRMDKRGWRWWDAHQKVVLQSLGIGNVCQLGMCVCLENLFRLSITWCLFINRFYRFYIKYELLLKVTGERITTVFCGGILRNYSMCWRACDIVVGYPAPTTKWFTFSVRRKKFKRLKVISR